MATLKDDIKAIIGRSPDISDTLAMRMFFVLKETMLPATSEDEQRLFNKAQDQFNRTRSRQHMNSTR